MFLLREALDAAHIHYDLEVVTDGEKALAIIDAMDRNENQPRPELIILDLNLPKKNGTEVLAHLKRSRRCGEIRVLIVTSSNSTLDRSTTSDLGANGYFCKPSSYDEFLEVGPVIRNLLES